MDARPKLLASVLFPLKEVRTNQIEDALCALTSAELITLYTVDGRPFLQMNTWKRHQRIRDSKEKYPGPERADVCSPEIAASCGELPQVAANRGELRPKSKSESNINKDIDEDAHAHDEGLPFGLTDDEIHASMETDRQLEEAARSVGLQVTEAGMMRGRELVREYGLDKVLDAISRSVDVPKWNYVEGVLRGGNGDGRRKPVQNHRGDSGGDHEKPRSKYASLFDEA